LEPILPAYDDPLFSIMLIVTLGLVIAVSTYAWGVYKQQKEKGYLLKFLDKFETSECTLDTHSMPFEMHMLKPLALLAKAFETSGEYHKAISIYLYLIKNIPEEHDKLELMERLGHTYLHAGFLERSKQIYKDILRKKPRNVKVLYQLGIVYEMMHKYKKAQEILPPLELLDEETYTLKIFLDLLQIQANRSSTAEHKIKRLKHILKEEPNLYREVTAALLKLDIKEAWEIIDPMRIKEILDILWFLPNSQLDLDIIKANHALYTLYYAKGYLQKPLQKPWKSGVFALDLLATARQYGFDQGELYFSYLCKKCKQSFPMSFKRCPNCMAIHSVEVKENIGKTSPKTDYSLL